MLISSGKLPWFQFYPSDWIEGTRMLNLEAKGAWMEIMNAMWTAPERGVLSGTLEEFSLLLSCYIDVTASLLDRFERLQICIVERSCNGIVTLRCRRMVREEAARESTRQRVAKHRGKRTCNGDVTPHVTDKKTEDRRQKTQKEAPPLPPKGDEVSVPLILQTPSFLQIWEDLKKDRKARKKPMTKRAQELSLEKCIGLGVDRAIEAIKHSIASGYQGLYEGPDPPKNGHANGHQNGQLKAVDGY